MQVKDREGHIDSRNIFTILFISDFRFAIYELLCHTYSLLLNISSFMLSCYTLAAQCTWTKALVSKDALAVTSTERAK